MPLPLKALLALAGASTIGGGIGLAAGSFGKKKAIEETENMFSDYNNEENTQLASEAFMQGVQFALSGAEGVEKQSFYKEYVEAGCKDEMEKIAKSGKLEALKKALGYKKNSRLSAILQGGVAAISPVHGVFGRARVPGLLTDLHNAELGGKHKAIAAAILAGGAGIGAGRMSKESSFNKEAGPRFNLAVEALKGLGGMAKRDAPAVGARIKEGLTLQNVRNYRNATKADKALGLTNTETKSIYRPDAIKDLGIAGAGVLGVAGIGMALKRALKNPSTKDQVLKYLSANKGKLAIAGGVGAGIAGTKALLD